MLDDAAPYICGSGQLHVCVRVCVCRCVCELVKHPKGSLLLNADDVNNCHHCITLQQCCSVVKCHEEFFKCCFCALVTIGFLLMPKWTFSHP